MAHATRKYLIVQDGINYTALAIASSAKESHLHVVSYENLLDTSHHRRKFANGRYLFIIDRFTSWSQEQATLLNVRRYIIEYIINVSLCKHKQLEGRFSNTVLRLRTPMAILITTTKSHRNRVVHEPRHTRRPVRNDALVIGWLRSQQVRKKTKRDDEMKNEKKRDRKAAKRSKTGAVFESEGYSPSLPSGPARRLLLARNLQNTNTHNINLFFPFILARMVNYSRLLGRPRFWRKPAYISRLPESYYNHLQRLERPAERVHDVPNPGQLLDYHVADPRTLRM